MIKDKLLCVFLGCCMCYVISCSPNSSDDDSILPKIGVSGVLYNQDGTRAKNAKITFVPFRNIPHPPLLQRATAVLDTAITDDTGAFQITSLASDTFVMIGSGNGYVSYSDSIEVKRDSTIIVPSCTLKAPGSIKGTILLEPGDDCRKIFILFLGTNIWSTPDDSIGNFNIGNLAEGRYRVRIMTTLDNYMVMDTSFTIKAGNDTLLPDPIKLDYTAIPIPKNLVIHYDSLRQFAALTWNKVDTANLSGYKVYRKHIDSNLVLISSSVKKDTTFTDSNVIQDGTYSYRVASVDDNDREGLFSNAVSVVAKTGFLPEKTIPFDSIQQQSDPFNFVISNDGSIFVTINQQSIAKFNQDGKLIKRFGSGIFRQITGMVSDANGSIYALNWDPDTSKVLKFSNDGDFITEWKFEKPVGYSIGIDSSMDMYIQTADEQSFRFVEKYDTTGTFLFLTAINQDGMEAVSPAGDIVTRNGDTEQYSVFRNGNVIDTFTVTFGGEAIAGIQAVDSKNNKYFSWFMVGSMESNGIFIFDKSNKLIGRWAPTAAMNQYFAVNHNNCYVFTTDNPISLIVFPMDY